MLYLQGTFLQLLALISCLSFSRARLLPTSKDLRDKYDFIVVGGGTGGNVVANRLSEDPSVSVLVIEAGGSNDVLESQVPFLWTRLIGSTHDWNYTSAPQTTLGGRSISLPRGRILGGSSSINGMLYSRGTSDDYDSIAELVGDPLWSWDRLQPYIKKNELWSPPSSNRPTEGEFDPSVHGRHGLVAISLPSILQPIDDRVLQTTRENSEFPFNLDVNSGHHLGIGWLQSTVTSAGKRASSATSYLSPGVINRSNLDVLLDAQVTRLLVSNATDDITFNTVEFVAGTGFPQSVKATREIVLSAGSIGTPNILLHSGIGDPTYLARVGIKSTHNLPSVGQNLTDHIIAVLPWFANSTETFETVGRNTSLQAILLEQWKANGTGLFSGSGIDHLGYVRLADNASIFNSVPDPAGSNTGHIEITITNGNIFAEPTPDNLILSEVMVTKTLARGSVTLNSSNPLDDPIIDPSYLAHEFDRFALREAVRSGQRFIASPAWEGYVLDRVGDFAMIDIQDDDQLDEYLRKTGSPGLHFVGTASMSPKGATWGVTDPDLKVKGLRGLRVVDASVIPLIPAAHTQVPVYIFAERAAAFIKEDWKLV
ncbi:hypothetical protein PC9H_000383 [Pleurotus ostreatus]|uniref:Glucose-methanol-choline oxidoreductase N-terminal domain-containing protein n=1 Tax=Pleurotus ostreatus TaxID=5322 RepID=A0A8H7A4P4_PLEOS|nr:uncharacterized protein PC9H_000383 [Pleurotus ostreatus]KAF7440042.1 hypothetical protein PC9H_000383 [Pleurotus ostreatus]KAJ8700724.1 hypothetical protein PTI98_003722 [Pleurotus ostreatus]